MNDNVKIEQIVLGSIISFPNIYPKLKSKLSLNIFTDPTHKIIFNVIEQLWENGKPFDLVIISKELSKKGIPNIKELDKYMIGLTMNVSSSANIESYLMILVEDAIKRDFVQKFSVLTNLAKQKEQDIFDLRDKAFETFDNLFIEKFVEANKQNETFATLVDKVEAKFQNMNNANGITGIPSSLDIINKPIGGWQNSDLTILAGRPGMGKTSFMIQQIIDVAKQDLAVGIFSLEMSAEQITSKIITNYTNIRNSSILRKGLNQQEALQYWDKKDDLVKLPIHIDDTPALTINDVKLKSKLMKMKYDIKILFIDYLQLIVYDKAKTREQEISKISRELKAVAKELDIPVIALSQLSRAVEQRMDKRPQLSDLRDSGSIEQDADEVIFLFRPEYYGIEQWEDGMPTNNQVEIILAKNRNGGTHSERYYANMATSSFRNYE